MDNLAEIVALTGDKPPGALSPGLASRVMAALNIEVAPFRQVDREADLQPAAGALGFPLVMKIDSPDISHKSDAGGVVAGLGDPAEVRKAYRSMLDRVGQVVPGARINGVTLHRQLHGVELAAGASRDPQFGPVVMVGTGGTHIELMGDVVFRVAPLDEDEALAAVRSVRAQQLFDGFRGHEPVDRLAVAVVLMQLGRMMVHCRRIEQVDLNPLICAGRRVVAADVRVIVGPAGERHD